MCLCETYEHLNRKFGVNPGKQTFDWSSPREWFYILCCFCLLLSCKCEFVSIKNRNTSASFRFFSIFCWMGWRQECRKCLCTDYICVAVFRDSLLFHSTDVQFLSGSAGFNGKCYYQWRANWYRNLLPVINSNNNKSITSEAPTDRKFYSIILAVDRRSTFNQPEITSGRSVTNLWFTAER